MLISGLEGAGRQPGGVSRFAIPHQTQKPKPWLPHKTSLSKGRLRRPTGDSHREWGVRMGR